MFEKYDVGSELFLASISVSFPKYKEWNTNFGNMLMMGEAGYGYITAVCKQGNTYHDLNNMDIEITNTRNPKITSYTIDFIKPLSKYSPLEGRIGKRKALSEFKKYKDEFNKDYTYHIQKTIKNHK